MNTQNTISRNTMFHVKDKKNIEDELASVLNYIFSLFPVEIELKLNRMEKLLKKLGNPEKKCPPIIHFAGTNGKGSTLSYLRAMFQAANLRVHAYTSPHLVHFHERIVIANQEITSPELLDILQECLRINGDDPITFFELTTCAAFLAFSRHEADILLLETGLGGRLDATNIITSPLMTVITPVSKDHTEFLGNALKDIAAEKAAIQKKGAISIIAPQEEEACNVIINYAKEVQSPCFAHGLAWSYTIHDDCFTLNLSDKSWEMPLPALLGEHQILNAATASTAAILLKDHFNLTDAQIKMGIADAFWPARLQKLSSGSLCHPHITTYLDGGHNEAGAKSIKNFFKQKHIAPEHCLFIMGMLKHKEIDAFLEHICPCFHQGFAITIPHHHAAIKAEELAQKALQKNKILKPTNDLQTLYTQVASYVQQTPTISHIFICGSLYLAGEILKDHN